MSVSRMIYVQDLLVNRLSRVDSFDGLQIQDGQGVSLEMVLILTVRLLDWSSFEISYLVYLKLFEFF